RGLGLLLDGWFAFIRGLKLESAASGRDLVGFGLQAIVPVNVHRAGAQQLKSVVEILFAGLRLADPVIGLAVLEQDFGLGDERINRIERRRLRGWRQGWRGRSRCLLQSRS